VGALRFNSQGEVIDYYSIVEAGRTARNCGVGRTGHGTLLTLEETYVASESDSPGRVWEASAFLAFEARPTTIGDGGRLPGGKFESAAWDNRSYPGHYYVTEDATYGALRRFTPKEGSAAAILAEGGVTHWLVVTEMGEPDGDGIFRGRYEFQIGGGAEERARDSQAAYYAGAEGIDFRPLSCPRPWGACGRVYFTAKKAQRLVILHVDSLWPNTGEIHLSSTVSGAFNRQPDQIAALVREGSDLVYFCEDGDHDCGVHARDGDGRFYTIVDGYPHYRSETTGLALTPDHKRMYFAYQDNSADDKGYVFELTRDDGYAFGGSTLDIKYHGD